MYYEEHEGTNAGILVQHRDGRKGIVRHEDQKKEFRGKGNGKVLVTMTDENYEPRDVKKHIISEDKLNFMGYVD